MKIPLLLLSFLLAALSLSAQVNPQCPAVSVEGPAGALQPGQPIPFTAIVKPTESTLTYKWRVSHGTIVEGQGTPRIKVRLRPDEPDVTASVEIGGLPQECLNIASETISDLAGNIPEAKKFEPFVCGLAPDDYPKLNRNDERARLYNAAHLWADDPKDVLVFLIYLAPNETVADAKRRATFIRDFYKNDKFFASEPLRITDDKLVLLFAASDRSHTAVYLFPAENVGSFAESFKASNNFEDIRPLK